MSGIIQIEESAQNGEKKDGMMYYFECMSYRWWKLKCLFCNGIAAKKSCFVEDFGLSEDELLWMEEWEEWGRRQKVADLIKTLGD